jgi:thiamine biosynthesis lipoprotein
VGSRPEKEYQVRWEKTHWSISFNAMASPCEILIRCDKAGEAGHLASLAFSETRRIESTYSRYRDDNLIYAINHSQGSPVEAHDELARLLDYADQCYRLSDGRFDITSGVLRRAWQFNGQQFQPNRELIDSLLEIVGWDKVHWDGHALTLLPGMEIDLGGIGKEFAVDIVAKLLFEQSGRSLMVNFGGDLRAIAQTEDSEPWIVGIENPIRPQSALGEIRLINGGVATSGDLNRFCLVDGQRLGHILNPQTGWPVSDAPRSVTVLGDHCVEAGFLATLAVLHGPDAEQFLDEQKVERHCVR